MKNKFRSMRIISPLLIFIAMALPSFAQKIPVFDNFPTSAGNVEMHFIGHGSLMFRVNNFVIYVDPVSSSGSYDNLPKGDLILVTHEHYDHLDQDLISRLRKDETILFTTEKVAAQVKGSQVMKAGDKNKAGNIGIEAVPAYNIVNMRALGQPFHPKGNGIGFILSIGDKKIYVECRDETGDKTQGQTTFKIIQDTSTPQIARVWQEGGTLHFITTEIADCRYTTENCRFKWDNASNADQGINHEISGVLRGNTYYIKCKDEFGNVPSDCSIKVKAL